MPAGYSGTPLVRKLGLKPGMACAVLNPPDGYWDLLEELSDGLTFPDPSGKELDFVHVFVREGRDLPDDLGGEGIPAASAGTTAAVRAVGFPFRYRSVTDRTWWISSGPIGRKSVVSRVSTATVAPPRVTNSTSRAEVSRGPPEQVVAGPK